MTIIEALESYDTDPDILRAEAHAVIGKAMREKDYDTALLIAHKTCTRFLGDPTLYVTMGRIYYTRMQWPLASPWYFAGFSSITDPDSPVSEQVETFSRHLTDDLILSEFANIAELNGMHELSDLLHQAYIREDPEHYRRTNLRGYHMLCQNRISEGLRHFDIYAKPLHDKLTQSSGIPAPWGGGYCKNLLITCMCGFGDTMQFFRYIDFARARVEHVHIAAEASIVPYLQYQRDDITLHVADDGMPQADALINIISLGRLYHETTEVIPNTGTYMKTDPAVQTRWRRRIAGYGGMKVGFAWQGSEYTQEGNSDRNMKYHSLSSLIATPGITAFSLQYSEPNIASMAPLPHPLGRFIDVAAEFTDFMQAAACVKSLDLVITICTATAHLAASLGVETWLLSKFTPDWRWQYHKTHSPWYDAVKIYRKNAFADWTDTIEVVRRDLYTRLGLATGAPDHQALTQAVLHTVDGCPVEEDVAVLQDVCCHTQSEENTFRALCQAYETVYGTDKTWEFLHANLQKFFRFADAYYWIAQLSTARGDHASAKTYLQMVLRLQPDHSVALARLINLTSNKLYDHSLAVKLSDTLARASDAVTYAGTL
ncbi:MAG: hypothetical protein AAF352_05065, partial [Pseudomonadota bacterium]